MATFTAILAAVWSFLKGVPPTVYTHAGAALAGFALRGCLAAALALALVGGAAAGEPCKCGPNCAAGGGCAPCLCAAAARDFGHDAYDALVRRLKPGDRFRVYVGCNMPPYDEGDCVRWDNYPGAKAPSVIVGEIRPDGSPWTVPQTPQRAPELIAPPQPARRFNFVATPFGGGCASGNCRRR